MRTTSILFTACILAVSINLNAQTKNIKLGSDIDSLSYSLGILIGNNLTVQGVKDLDDNIFFKGFQDGFTQNPQEMTMEQANMFVQSYFEKQMAMKSENNLKEGLDFLAENAKKEGVVTLNSGLQYKVLQAGSGASPKAGDQVKVQYKGTLIDGTVFDSSYDRGQPAQFGCSQVIKGWTEALLLMSPGSHWMLYIPSDLAYGQDGAGDVIGQNATLIFEVELLEVIPRP
jgi:FKBP-type peptidyl-prolyl cis-trans isomerase FklB